MRLLAENNENKILRDFFLSQRIVSDWSSEQHNSRIFPLCLIRVQTACIVLADFRG